jgi:hypothetical protein
MIRRLRATLWRRSVSADPAWSDTSRGAQTDATEIACLNFVDAQFGVMLLGLVHEKFHVQDCSAQDRNR